MFLYHAIISSLQITSLTNQLQEMSVKTEELMTKNSTVEEENMQVKSELLAKVRNNIGFVLKCLKKILRMERI